MDYLLFLTNMQLMHQTTQLIESVVMAYTTCMETINDNTFLRGEPIAAMDVSLTQGILPGNKRDTNIDAINTTHRPDRVSIGKGDTSTNPAFMPEFFTSDSIIYIIDSDIATNKGFTPNNDHPNNREYLAKKVPASMIKGIITHDEHFEYVKTKVHDLGIDIPVIKKSNI